MRSAQKHKRHEAITQAAYSLLAAKGYDGASMLSIAKAAKASNETLYRWYGDKRGLFEAMVRDNAEAIRLILEGALKEEDEPAQTLQRVAPLLLEMLLGERAILLNRAAAADPSGELGAAIAAGGRDVIQPMIADLIAVLCKGTEEDVTDLTNWFIGLLIGDLQIKRAIGVMGVPTSSDIQTRSQKSLDVFFTLLRDT